MTSKLPTNLNNDVPDNDRDAISDYGPLPKEMWEAVRPKVTSHQDSRLPTGSELNELTSKGHNETPQEQGSSKSLSPYRVEIGSNIAAEERQERFLTNGSSPSDHAVKNGKVKDERWHDKALSELSAVGIRVPFLYEGYIAIAMITLFTALWKSGKTTWLAHLLKAGDGSETHFCGQKIEPMKALIISEESESKWAERRDNLSIGDHVHVICRPFSMRPTIREWLRLLACIAELVKEKNYNLVIFDTAQNLWCVRDENDAAQVIEALMPLNKLTGAGAAVLLAMHPAKSDAGEGRMTRGSGATPGFVDIMLEMRRFDAERRDDTRRTLTAYSRFDDTPTEKVIELDRAAQMYRAVGTKASAKVGDRLAVILQILTDSKGGQLTPEDIYLRWEDKEIARPSIRTIRRHLEDAVLNNHPQIREIGVGVKNDPKRYYLV